MKDRIFNLNAEKDIKTRLIIAVIYTTCAAVKVKPEKNSDLNRTGFESLQQPKSRNHNCCDLGRYFFTWNTNDLHTSGDEFFNRGFTIPTYFNISISFSSTIFHSASEKLSNSQAGVKFVEAYCKIAWDII